MPEFIYVLRPERSTLLTDGPTEVERPILARHFEYLAHLAESGIVELAGRTLNTDETAFGLVVLHAEDEDEAHAIMDEDPAVVEGVMSATLFAYRVALRGKRPEGE